MNQFVIDEASVVPFIEGQRRHIETEVNRAPLVEIQYPRLIPVDTSANPWVDTVEFSSVSGHGKAEWINGNADDIPRAGAKRELYRSSVYMAGIGYGYGYEEVEKARLYGTNLSTEDAFYARRAAEEMVERVALRGDATKNMEGLFDHSAVTPEGAPNGGWETATEDEILADVNEALAAPMINTNYVGWANTILMSPERLQILGTRRLSDTSMTLLQWVRQNNAFTLSTGQPLLISAAHGLSAAGVGGTQRMIAYRRDPQVLKLHYPMPHRFLPAREDGVLRWVVPGIMRLGGLDIRRPMEVVYRDGI